MRYFTEIRSEIEVESWSVLHDLSLTTLDCWDHIIQSDERQMNECDAFSDVSCVSWTVATYSGQTEMHSSRGKNKLNCLCYLTAFPSWDVQHVRIRNAPECDLQKFAWKTMLTFIASLSRTPEVKRSYYLRTEGVYNKRHKDTIINNYFWSKQNFQWNFSPPPLFASTYSSSPGSFVLDVMSSAREWRRLSRPKHRMHILVSSNKEKSSRLLPRYFMNSSSD